MRLSGLVIFVLLLGSTAFVYLGFSKPDISFRTHVSVNAPVERTYSVFTDTSKASTWVANLVRVDLLRGDPGAVGSFYRLNFIQDGKAVIATQHYVALQPASRVAYDVELPNSNNSVEVLFEPLTRGTRITTYNTVRGKGLFWQAMLQLKKGSLSAQQQANYRRFKAIVERQ